MHVRRESGGWKEISLGEDVRIHSLDNLKCGTQYEIYMTAYNKIGVGYPSDVRVISTNGSGKLHFFLEFYSIKSEGDHYANSKLSA